MAENKEFTVGMKVSLEGIEALERKLRELNSNQRIVEQAQKATSKLEGTGLAGISPQIKESLEKAAKEYQKALGGLMGNYLKEVNEIKKAFEDQVQRAKELTAERDRQIKGSQQYLQLEKEIAATQENAKAQEARYQRAIERGSDIFGQATKVEAKKSVEQTIQEEKGGLKGIGFAAAAAIVAALPKLLEQEGARPIVTAAAAGSAVRGTTGREINAMLNGDIIREMAYMPEKAQAVQDARRAQQMRQHAEALSPLTTILSGGLLGAGIGAGVGAAGGPIGMLGGAAVGAIGGAGKVGWDMLTDQRYRSAQLSPYSESQRTTYQAMQAQDFAENFAKALQAQQELNPLKSVAVDYLSKYSSRDLNAQRQMGLSDTGYYGEGGYLERGTAAGFTPESRLAMSSQILGAGGSTRAARGSMVGLLAQRNMDITNAGALMGKLSATGGDVGNSEAMLRKILEASFRAGLDNSEFREEQRKFAETTANILNQAGIANPQDAERTVQGFTRFMGEDRTMKGMEGAKSAYEEFQQQTSATGGRLGAIQFAEMMKEPGLRKLNPMAMGALAEIPENQLSEQHPRIIAAAHQAGISPADLVESLKKRKGAAFALNTGENTEKEQALGEWMQKNQMDLGGNLSQEQLDYMQKYNPEGYQTYMRAVTGEAYGGQYVNAQKSRAVLRGRLKGNMGAGTDTGAAMAVAGELYAPGTGAERTADKAEQAMAVASDAMIKNFNSFKDSIVPATTAVDDFTKKLIALSQAMVNIPESQRAAMGVAISKQAQEAYLQQAAKMQPQGIKPGPGR